MKLSDLIIEHGPWTDGDAAALLTLRAAQGRAGRELNELREELIAARNSREVRKRITVEADIADQPLLRTVCDRCGTEAELDGNLALDELDLRAQEHAEVCG